MGTMTEKSTFTEWWRGEIFPNNYKKENIENDCWQQNYIYHMYIAYFHNIIESYFSILLFLLTK